MSTPFLFVPIFRAFDTAGNPLAGGLLYTYAAGTTTPLATYSDAAGLAQNANPVVLDSTGSATIRLGGGAYKFVLKDSGGSTQWTEDNYQPVGDSPTFFSLTLTNLIVSSLLTVGGIGELAQLLVTGDSTGKGLAIVRTKTADTFRQSTTALAADPDLSVPIIGTANQVEAFLIFDSVAAAAGFKYTFTYSGTTALNNFGLQTGFVNSVPTGPTNIAGFIGAAPSFAPVATAANSNYIYLNFILHAPPTPGNLTVNWAQSASTASNTTLRTDSYLKVTRLT